MTLLTNRTFRAALTRDHSPRQEDPMTETITARIENGDNTITASIEPTGLYCTRGRPRITGKVSIAVNGIQAGDGLWGHGGDYIVDCDARLGADEDATDAAYEALDDAIAAACGAYLAALKERIALVFRAADDEGTIQAWDMLPLADDPTMHTTCSTRRLIRHYYPWIDQDDNDVLDWFERIADDVYADEE